ncbi:MAG: DUF433 domain-containing protein [Endozoicomonas sp.]
MSDQGYQNYIEVDHGKRFGKPCIKGTRVAVTDVLEMLAEGMSQEDILRDHPNLDADKIKAALLYASNHINAGAA